MNYFQHGLGSSGDDLIKSTIFEEDEESPSNRSNPKPPVEDEDISLPAFPELQYLDISFNLVKSKISSRLNGFSDLIEDRRRR